MSFSSRIGRTQKKDVILPRTVGYVSARHIYNTGTYEGWNFNFGNTPLDWIQELLE